MDGQDPVHSLLIQFLSFLQPFVDPETLHTLLKVASTIHTLLSPLIYLLFRLSALPNLILPIISDPSSEESKQAIQSLIPPLVALIALYFTLLSLWRTTTWAIRVTWFFIKWGVLLSAVAGGASWLMAAPGQEPRWMVQAAKWVSPNQDQAYGEAMRGSWNLPSQNTRSKSSTSSSSSSYNSKTKSKTQPKANKPWEPFKKSSSSSSRATGGRNAEESRAGGDDINNVVDQITKFVISRVAGLGGQGGGAGWFDDVARKVAKVAEEGLDGLVNGGKASRDAENEPKESRRGKNGGTTSR